MAYIGNPPAEAYTNTVKDSFNGDGSTVAFTMSQPSVTNDVRVVVENVIQDPTVAYSCSGTTLTFTSAPPSGTNNIYVVHLGPAVMTTVPPSEIASATTFASAVTVQGAFTSQGIDDNATSTAMTLDSSGNLLVGKTTTAIENAGLSILSTGRIIGTADSDDVAVLRRNTSDGDIISFRKDGSTVGSIGTAGGTLTIDGGGTSSGIYFGENQLVPRDNGAGSNNIVDLGQSGNSFKDLYLSGGVFLGGVGSSNKLDDYEEGTWTPVIDGSITLTNAGRYIKIGTLVFVSLGNQDGLTAISAGATMLVTGLPFNIATGGWDETSTASACWADASAGYALQVAAARQDDNNRIAITNRGTAATNTGDPWNIALTYRST